MANAKVLSTYRLGDNERSKIEEVTRNKLGNKKLSFDYVVDKSLGAGIVIKTKSKTIDLSLKGRINKLVNSLNDN